MKKLLTSVIFLCCTAALAGPCRPVRSGNFQVGSPCGPDWDPYAQQGQWFLDPLSGGVTNVNSWEYHDDATSLSIAGTVSGISFALPGDTNSNIIAFDVQVTVSNSLPADYSGGSATNSHYETQNAPGVFYQEGMMNQVRITAEFALADHSMQPPAGFAPPYWLDPVSGGSYYIEAMNEDEWAWYCWWPGAPDPLFQPGGMFQVPAWRLQPFDIPPGGSSSILMSFQVTGAGMPKSDYRHSVIRASQQMGLDVLYNRHTSLKISHWVDTLLVDNGYVITAPSGDYEPEEPPEYIYASDCSVFFNSSFENEKTRLTITPILTNRTPDAVRLDWTALDAINYQVQACSNLLSNNWVTAANSPGLPAVVPASMQWTDDGTVFTNLPVQQQTNRYYRLIEP